MCGIFGHTGKSHSVDVCLKGLKILEYRGYDSAGIAGVEEGSLFCFKEKGKLSELEKALSGKKHSFSASIGHTRWATHGKASRINAHPQSDKNQSIALVHNGILENHGSLRKYLLEKGVTFTSETDTEVIVQLIALHYEGDLVKAVRKSLPLMQGFWSLAIIHKDHPGQIVATRLENPLLVGVSTTQSEAFISSDPQAFGDRDLDIYTLGNREIASVTQEGIQIFDEEARELEKEPELFDREPLKGSKGSFPHFMLKEIHDQPSSIISSLHSRLILNKADADFENFSPSQEELREIKEVLFLGCGTSWHAGCIAALQFEELTHVKARAEIASEYRFKPSKVDKHTLVIALSQSGETFDTLAAMRKSRHQGARVLALCNVPSSTMMREANYSILLRAGPEVSVCSTKAFTCQLAVLSLIALKLARAGSMDIEEGRDFLKDLTRVPSMIEDLLERQDEIRKVAKKYAYKSKFFFLGRQCMSYVALEAALKVKEITYASAFGYPAGELKHGPIALIDSESLVIGLCAPGPTYEKILSNLHEVKARGGHILTLGPETDEVADDVITIPSLNPTLAPLPYSVVCQLLSYYIAVELDREIDQPRNLAKSVTVE